jgi:alpha-glucosidase
LRAARPDARPFVLTRASHLAGSRFAATWTGDNQARWEDLAWSIPMVLNLGLSGQPFSGPDVGGFYGDPDAELFVRWFELGAFLPFFRGHSEKSSCRKEPWAFGEEALAHVRRALERRMRLLPMLYTLFELAARTGLPVARPACFADPTDPDLREVDDTFLLGEDLLVAPVVEPGLGRRSLRLPANPGGWYAFDLGSVLDGEGSGPGVDSPSTIGDGPRTGGDGAELGGESTRLVSHWTGSQQIEVAAPLGTTPCFARAGSILVTGPVRRHTGEADVLRIWHVFPDRDGLAHGSLYEDDGETRAHRQGDFRRTAARAWLEQGRPCFETQSHGPWRPPPRREIVLRYEPK